MRTPIAICASPFSSMFRFAIYASDFLEFPALRLLRSHWRPDLALRESSSGSRGVRLMSESCLGYLVDLAQ